MILTYSMLLNIALVASAPNTDVIWGCIRNYEPSATPESNPDLAAAVARAARYFTRRVAPDRKFWNADPKESTAFADLRSELLKLEDGTDAEELQRLVYVIGRKYEFEPMRDWFPDFDSLTRFQLRFELAHRCAQGDSGSVVLRSKV